MNGSKNIEVKDVADEVVEKKIRYTYDSEGKLTEVSYPTTKGGIQGLSYTYDDYGKVKEIKDYRNILGDGDKAIKKMYTYDTFDRVTKMVYVDLADTDQVMESYTYRYDKNSNITSKTEINHYPSKDADQVNETKNYTYDSLGRLTKSVTTNHLEDDSKKTNTYTYDGENRLKTVSSKTGDNTTLIQTNDYNGDGQRIQKVEGDTTTNYYYQDGTVSYTTDGSADVTYRYTDFGETSINGDNKSGNEVCYTGGIYDASTGLYYLNARYYTLTNEVRPVRSTMKYGMLSSEIRRMEDS